MAKAELVGTLVAIQRANRWTDTEMAAKLGVSQSGWTLIKNGQRSPGRRTLRGVVRAFPELREAAVLFLAEDMTTSMAV